VERVTHYDITGTRDLHEARGHVDAVANAFHVSSAVRAGQRIDKTSIQYPVLPASGEPGL